MSYERKKLSGHIFPSILGLLDPHLRAEHAWSLEKVLLTYCRTECSDSRDRVFGLQALIAPHERISVDYTKSPATLVREAMVIFLRSPSMNVPSSWMWTFETWDLTIRDCDELHRWGRIEAMVAPKGNNDSRTVKTMAWAYLVPSTFLLIMHESRTRKLFTSWPEMFKDCLWLATTPYQERFSKRLCELEFCFQDFERKLSERRTGVIWENHGWIKPGEDFLKEPYGLINNVAAELGFAMYGDFLQHPDELPTASIQSSTYAEWHEEHKEETIRRFDARHHPPFRRE
jgi:hypothetical protein